MARVCPPMILNHTPHPYLQCMHVVVQVTYANTIINNSKRCAVFLYLTLQLWQGEVRRSKACNQRYYLWRAVYRSDIMTQLAEGNACCFNRQVFGRFFVGLGLVLGFRGYGILDYPLPLWKITYTINLTKTINYILVMFYYNSSRHYTFS